MQSPTKADGFLKKLVRDAEVPENLLLVIVQVILSQQAWVMCKHITHKD